MAILIKPNKEHWLTESASSGLLLDNQGVIYIEQKPNGKLGLIKPGTHTNKGLGEALEARYRNQASAMNENFIADAYGFECDNKDILHDNKIRAKIHEEYLNGNAPFDAYSKLNNKAPDGDNTEAMPGYEPNNPEHIDYLRNTIVNYFDPNVKDTRIPWVPRNSSTPYGQDLMIDQLTDKFSRFNRVAFNGHTGLAKTMIAAAVAHRIWYNNGSVILATSPVVDTIDDIDSNFSDWNYPVPGVDTRKREVKVLRGKDFCNTTSADILNMRSNGIMVVLAIGIQDLRYGADESNGHNIRDKYSDIFDNIEFDAWIRDEAAHTYNGAITKKVLKNVKWKQLLDLSASINKVRPRYHPDAIVDRGIFWAMEYENQRGTPKVLIDVLSGAVEEALPERYRDRYCTEEGFLPLKMVEKSDAGILQSLPAFDSLFESQYLSEENRDMNPLSIRNDTDIPLLSRKIGLHVLPEGINGDTASEYINQLATDLNSMPKYVYKYTENSKKELVPYRGKVCFVTPYNWKQWIDEKRGKCKYRDVIEDLETRFEHVTILTCRTWVIGSNIPRIGHVCLWDKMTDPYLIEQLFPGRGYRVVEGKTHIKLYVLTPGVKVQESFCVLAKQTASARPDKPCPTVLLKNINLKAYSNLRMEKVDFADVFREFNDTNRASVKRVIPGDAILDAVRNTAQYDQLARLEVDKNKYLDGGGGELTEDNGAKKGEKKKEKKKKRAGRRSNDEKLVDNIRSVMAELPPFTVPEGITDIVDALKHEQISNLFGKDNVDQIVDAVENNASLQNLLQDKLTDWHHNLAMCGFDESHDIIFRNTSKKKEIGVVFINMPAAQFFAEQMKSEMNIPGKYSDTIAVQNALSGSVPFCLQKMFPYATIVCIEHHPYYRNLLSSKGFFVYGSAEDYKRMKNPEIKYWFLNPPYQKDAHGSRDESNKQGSFWYPFIDSALTTEAATDDAKYFIVSPKSIYGTGYFGSKSYKISRVREHAEFKHVFPDLSKHFPNVGIAITGYVIDKEKTDTTVTVDGYTETIEIDGSIPIPFEVSPLALNVVKKCWSRNETIGFVDKLPKQDDDVAVLRVDGGRWKSWRKTTVGYEKDTTNNKNGAIISASEIAGYKSAIKSELWTYLVYIFGIPKGNSPTNLMKHMPVMSDMTKSHTDDEWYKEFNIGDEMQQGIRKYLREHK